MMKKRGKITPNGVVLKTHEKAPLGEGNQLMENTVQRALKQSQNVIIDLRHTKRHQTKCLRELEKQFASKKSLKRLKIITKSGKTLDFDGDFRNCKKSPPFFCGIIINVPAFKSITGLTLTRQIKN